MALVRQVTLAQRVKQASREPRVAVASKVPTDNMVQMVNEVRVDPVETEARKAFLGMMVFQGGQDALVIVVFAEIKAAKGILDLRVQRVAWVLSGVEGYQANVELRDHLESRA